MGITLSHEQEGGKVEEKRQWLCVCDCMYVFCKMEFAIECETKVHLLTSLVHNYCKPALFKLSFLMYYCHNTNIFMRATRYCKH